MRRTRLPLTVAAVLSAFVASNVRPLLMLLVVVAYIAFALVPGPRRTFTGIELPILTAVGMGLIAIGLSRPNTSLFLAGVLAVGLGFANSALGGPAGRGGWLAELLFPTGWTLLGSSAWSWRGAAATYVVAGLWTLFLIAAPEGILYFDGPLHDADQLFHNVLLPIAFWPYVTFGMLGVFGQRFV
jgi:hypothetical protein